MVLIYNVFSVQLHKDAETLGAEILRKCYVFLEDENDGGVFFIKEFDELLLLVFVDLDDVVGRVCWRLCVLDGNDLPIVVDDSGNIQFLRGVVGGYCFDGGISAGGHCFFSLWLYVACASYDDEE